jgi:hypothetical protein
MNITSLHIRRSLTLAGAVAALVLGFSAIQAAAAWTADAAPLSVAPVSVKTIESKLADEQNRSSDLQAQLQELAGNTEQMTAALAAAQARIDADTAHAAQLEKDLKAAKKKLATLQRSISQAAARPVAQARTTSTAPAAGGSHEGSGDD